MQANRLREARIDALLTQEQLAEKAGVSVSVVIDAEMGRRVPRPLNQERLARVLGVDRLVLFPEPEEATA